MIPRTMSEIRALVLLLFVVYFSRSTIYTKYQYVCLCPVYVCVLITYMYIMLQIVQSHVMKNHDYSTPTIYTHKLREVSRGVKKKNTPDLSFSGEVFFVVLREVA